MRVAKPALGGRARIPKLAVVAQIAVNVPTVRFVRAVDRTGLVLQHEQFAVGEFGTPGFQPTFCMSLAVPVPMPAVPVAGTHHNPGSTVCR